MAMRMLKNKKGFGTFELVIFSLIFIAMISFLVDLSLITWQYNSVSNLNSFVTNTISQQSGISNTVPHGYPNTYITSQQLYNIVVAEMAQNGIREGDWDIRINNTALRPNTNIRLNDPKQSFTITLTTSYEWRAFSNFVPIRKGEIRSVKMGYPRFLFREEGIKFLK